MANPVAAVAAAPHRSHEHSPTATRSRAESPPNDDVDAVAVARAHAADGSSGVPPPSLSHLVAASLTAAASHERAILKWARDIQNEVDAYKASVIRGAHPNSQNDSSKGRQRKKAPAVDPLAAHLGKLTSLDPAFTRGSSLSPPRRPTHASGSRTARDFFGNSSTGNFMRDDIISIHPRGKGRFLPKNLVKIAGDGPLSAREAPTSPRAISQSFGNAALYHHRATVIARRKAAAEAAVARAAQAAEAAAAESHGAGVTQGNGHLIAAMYGATAIPPSAHVPAPTAQAALQPLPAALAPVDPSNLADGSGAAAVELDESASFKSPALYMDMKMRQLFHPDTSAAGGSASAPLSSSQKAHVMLHLLDVLGELVEPDSQQAYQVLNDTLKQLILAADYKNLIPVQGNSGTSSHAGKSLSTGLAGSATAAGSSAALAAQHKELLRLDRLKWNAQGNLKAGPEGRDPKTLMQALADGSLDKKIALPAGLSKLEILKAERIKERERLDRERAEREALMKKSESSAAASDRDSSDPTLRRKPLPHIAFEGDFIDGGGVANSSVAPGAVVPWKPAVGVGSHAAGPIARASPAVLANLRQIPASALDVAWTLKADVESLCARLDSLAAARASLEAEGAKPVAEDHSFLQSWSQKKSLQTALYQRGEVMLCNEIVILKHLLVDLKEELECINEENILLEEDYLAHGLVFGGSFAMESFRHEEETRNYPLELARARKAMEKTLAHIEDFKRDLAEIHTERDLLLTRIEVLEQAVNMMHNEEEEEGEEAAENDEERKKTKDAPPPLLDPSGYPFVQQHSDDLRGRGSSNLSLPLFLRFDGWFPRLRFSKQEVEVRIKEIWSLKTIADEKAKQVGQQANTLTKYMQEYLEKRFLGGRKMGEETTVATAAEAAATGDAPSPTAAAATPGASDSSSSPPSPSSLATASRLYPLHSFVSNFFATLESHCTDQDFILFLKVIRGEMHEEHYRDQMKMLANFKEAMWRWDLSENQVAAGSGAGGSIHSGSSVAHHSAIDGLISLDTFTAGLRKFFPHKSKRHMAELRSILERDCMTTTTLPGSSTPVALVDSRKILCAGEDDAATGTGGDGVEPADDSSDASDALGSTYLSNFLEAIRAQYLSEIESFVARIQMDLIALSEVRRTEKARAAAAAAAAAEDETTSGSSTITKPLDPRSSVRTPMLSAYDIRSVLRAADLHRSTEALTDLLRRGCNEPYLSKDTEVPVMRFMANLTSSGLVHTTDHWKRIPVKTPSLDAAARDAALAEEEAKAAALDDENKSFMHASAARPYFARRASLEDESVYLAARAAAGNAPTTR